MFAFSAIFGILQNLKTQGYDFYNKELSNGFEIKDILDATINKFLIYPKKVFGYCQRSLCDNNMSYKRSEFVYEFEQIDFFATAHYGFVSLFQSNVEGSEKIDFSNIKKLQITWDKKVVGDPKYFYEDYNENGKKDSLYYDVYDVTKSVYYHSWGNAVYGGNPILLSQN